LRLGRIVASCVRLVSAGILVLVEQALRKGDIAERLGCEREHAL
jgi:hypothetical protein